MMRETAADILRTCVRFGEYGVNHKHNITRAASPVTRGAVRVLQESRPPKKVLLGP